MTAFGENDSFIYCRGKFYHQKDGKGAIHNRGSSYVLAVRKKEEYQKDCNYQSNPGGRRERELTYKLNFRVFEC